MKKSLSCMQKHFKRLGIVRKKSCEGLQFHENVGFILQKAFKTYGLFVETCGNE